MNFAIFWYHSLLISIYYILSFFFAFSLWILLSHFLLPRAYHDHVWSTWSTWGILRRRGREKEERKRLCSNIFLQINQMCNLLFFYICLYFFPYLFTLYPSFVWLVFLWARYICIYWIVNHNFNWLIRKQNSPLPFCVYSFYLPSPFFTLLTFRDYQNLSSSYSVLSIW